MKITTKAFLQIFIAITLILDLTYSKNLNKNLSNINRKNTNNLSTSNELNLSKLEKSSEYDKNIKSIIDKNFDSIYSFLQTGEKGIQKGKKAKKIKRLLLIFPLRRIIILRGKKLVKAVKSLPIWKKRVFLRIMKSIVSRTVRTNKIRRMKVRLVSKIKNLLKKLQNAKPKKKN